MTPLGYTIDQVVARLQELSVDGVPPSVRTWNRKRGAGMPGYETLFYHGYIWPQLIEAAGLELPKRGGRPGNTNTTSAVRAARFAAMDAEVEQMAATAEPPRPDAWPLAAIPTRTEIRFGQLPDGTPVRVTRQYFSLR